MSNESIEKIELEQLEQDDWVSRTEKKRNTEDMQVFARSIMNLSDNQRKNLPMSEELNDAIVLAVKIKKNKEAFRRQMQLVGKFLRQSDIEEIKMAMNKLTLHYKNSDPELVKIEAIRDNMVNNGDKAVNAFLEQHPIAERQRLRQLIRQIKKEAKLEKPLKSAKELSLYIKSVQEL